MGFLNKILGKNDVIKSNEDFWKWFVKEEQYFYKAFKKRENLDDDFLEKIAAALNQLDTGCFYLAGMYDDDTAELIITADGAVKNFVHVDALVAAAPNLPNWKFTAYKPENFDKGIAIHLDELVFNEENIAFCPIVDEQYPDDINIELVYTDNTATDKEAIEQGIILFLENYLGELNFATAIDEYAIVAMNELKGELIPMTKLESYLIWRKKEFVEKYESTLYDTKNDTYALMEGTLPNGNPIIATMNVKLLKWDDKPSHPWLCVLEMKYKIHENGMPNEAQMHKMEELEEDVNELLIDNEGYLNIGRQTADGDRIIFFACKEYSKPSVVLAKILDDYKNDFELTFDIYKDKYWKSLAQFVTQV